MHRVLIQVLIILLIVSSLLVSHGEGIGREKLEDLKLNETYYDDDEYLYFALDTNMVRLKKDFTGNYEIVSQEEQERTIKNAEECKKSYILNRIELESEEIEIKDDHVYYDGLELLDIKRYVELDNEFYENNTNFERSPMRYKISKYNING